MNEVKPPKKPVLFYYGIILLVIVLLNAFVFPSIRDQFVKEVDYSTFLTLVEDGKVSEAQIEENYITFLTKEDGRNVFRVATINDPQLVERLHESGVQFSRIVPKELSPFLSFLLSWILPLVILVTIGQFFMKRLQGRMGGGTSPMTFGKSRAKIYVEAQTGITFNDVAGQNEAKEALQEIVDFLHNPGKYKEIGAKIPKGALLVGPQGYRKDFIGKAVAGESKVPFFNIRF